MSFASYSFVLLLLPFSLVLFHLPWIKGWMRQLVLIASSTVFIASSGLLSLGIGLISILINHVACVLICAAPPHQGLGTPLDNSVSKLNCNENQDKDIWFQSKRRIVFWIAVCFNICLLLIFKYFAPADSFPLGLSFLTFSELLYLKEVYCEGKTPGSLLDDLAWLSFFARYTQGPIIGLDANTECRKAINSSTTDWNALADGISLFVLGLSKKLLIADNLAIIVNNAWDNLSALGLVSAWIAALSYSFQLYFDFSGYSDMAVGIGLMFGMKLPENFNSPYKSSSVSEFWRRWHITLGKALTQLVYIPLGGNRKGKLRTCINLVIVMLVSGFWHGEGGTFILWGLLNGSIMVIERLTGLAKKTSCLQKCLTFLLVNFLWVIFRASSISEAGRMFTSMFGLNGAGTGQFGILANDGILNWPDIIDTAWILFLLIISIVLCCARRNSNEIYKDLWQRRSSLFVLPVLFILCFLCFGRGIVFLYQNF